MLNARYVWNSCVVVCAVAVAASFISVARAEQAAAGVRQPLFLLCPHTAHYSAWSLYLMVDDKDPKKILSLGLEKLKDKNSKDTSYEDVVAAQADAKTSRENVASLDAKEFGHGELNVAKDDALHVSLTPAGDGFTLGVSLRISANDRFTIGGRAQGKQDVALKYDETAKTWSVQVKVLSDAKGKSIDGVAGQAMTGIVFPVTGTGIYTVLGVLKDGETFTLLERGGMKGD